jgi:hypothetical protein
MRFALALPPFIAFALGGCIEGEESPRSCSTDDRCGGDVCAADARCRPATELRTVTTSWTLNGMPATATTCATAPTLGIGFEGTLGGFLLSHDVPCETGVLIVERVPMEYDTVVMSFLAPRDAIATITEGNAVIDFVR